MGRNKKDKYLKLVNLYSTRMNEKDSDFLENDFENSDFSHKTDYIRKILKDYIKNKKEQNAN